MPQIEREREKERGRSFVMIDNFGGFIFFPSLVIKKEREDGAPTFCGPRSIREVVTYFSLSQKLMIMFLSREI